MIWTLPNLLILSPSCLYMLFPLPRILSLSFCHPTFHHPRPLPASQKTSRLDPGGAPAGSQVVPRRRTRHPNTSPLAAARRLGQRVPRANRSLATRLLRSPPPGHPAGTQRSLLPTAIRSPHPEGTKLSPSRDLGNPCPNLRGSPNFYRNCITSDTKRVERAN